MVFSKIKNLIFIILGFPIYYISILLPKKKNLSVIGSSLGQHFADNSKYFYINHYNSVKSRKSKELIWITKNKKVVNELRLLDLPVEFLYSFRGIYTTLRASRAYISHQLKDIDGTLMGGAQIIQLWHGMPLRKIGFGGDWSNNNFKGKVKSFISKWFPYAYYMKCDILYAPCLVAKENYLEPFSKSFRNKNVASNIIIKPQARSRCFDDNFNLTSEFFPERKFLLSLKDKYDNIVSWLPTQRRQFDKTILDVIFDSGLDMVLLDQYCKSKNILFVIKAHFLDFDNIREIIQDLEHVLVYPYSDPYPLLKYTDILITDYSSVFFDFLILNKPIIFMCHDLEEYTQEVEFYYDFKNLQIGPICMSWQKVYKVIAEIQNNKDNFKEKRNKIFRNFEFVTNRELVKTKVS